MSTTTTFQYYLEKYFKFPKEIKHDIIYCQRSLKAHIKVHQMVLDVYKSQANPDPIQKKRIIDELETEIYEINAEQHFLLLRLRRVIDEFYKTANRKGVHVMPDIVNDVISNELVPLINDSNLLIYPMSVRLRCSEDKLIEKYFEAKNESAVKQESSSQPTNYFEILDSDEEEQNRAMAAVYTKPKPKPFGNKNMGNDYNPKLYGECNKKEQISLLKPISQRASSLHRGIPSSHRQIEADTFIDASQFVEITEDTNVDKVRGGHKSVTIVPPVKKRGEPARPNNIPENKNTLERDESVSKNVKMSRLNLRQALKKVHNETMAAKAAANVYVKAPSITTTLPKPSTTLVADRKEKLETRTRVSRTVNAPAGLPSAVKPIEVNSSSDDSNPEHNIASQHQGAVFPTELVDVREKPEEYGQEMFLRMFGLYTPEMRLQMQQRRSKRKRRTVQSNERSDFHYGRIEYGSYPPPEDKKKRKAFLLSPQVKRMQSKRPKRRSAEKFEESASRSSSSSPDEKRGCNECLKGGGSLDCCEGCKGFYHQSCHREVDDIYQADLKSIPSLNKVKLCPACKRLQSRIVKKEAKQYQDLKTSAKDLQRKLAEQKTRRASLQQEGETFKHQMNTLYNIVKAIKSDPENSSD